MKGRENLKDVISDGTKLTEWVLSNKKKSESGDGPIKTTEAHCEQTNLSHASKKASDVFVCILAVKLVYDSTPRNEFASSTNSMALLRISQGGTT